MENIIMNAKNEMLVRLTDKFISTHNAKEEYKEFIADNKGKLLKVDTDYLFDNQYNVTDEKGRTARIYDTHITEVLNDKRTKHHVQCKYCGKQRIGNTECSCNKGIVNPFTQTKSFFMNENAKQIKEFVYNMDDVKDLLKNIKGIEISEHVPNHIKINNYSLSGYPELGYFRVDSARDTINFLYDGIEGIYYISNGIGYTKTKDLGVPQAVQNKLNKIMHTIWLEKLELNITDEFDKFINLGLLDLSYKVEYTNRMDVNGNKLYSLQVFDNKYNENVTSYFKGFMGRYNSKKEQIVFNSYEEKNSIKYIIKNGLK